MSKTFGVFVALACGAALCGCQSMPMQAIQTVSQVDLQRFMGDWYVIANIPTPIEKQAFNAVESYRLGGHSIIETTFTFNKGSLDGPLKTYKPKGFVQDKRSNAVWGMQFIWPIKAEYLIAALDANYTETIIARNKRDYVWIMARTPRISDADYARLTAKVAALGYDVRKLRKIPHGTPRQAGS